MTSTALALAAVWPRPVVLLEADLAGGDLAYRCRAAPGGPIPAAKGLLRLAAAVRGGVPDGHPILEEAELLGCGASLVPGVSSSAQARGLSGLWSSIAAACTAAEVDVIADLGRLDRASAHLPLAQASTYLLPVLSTSLESVMHLTDGLQDLMGALAQHGAESVMPVLVGPDARAARDRADLDELLGKAGLPTLATRSMPHDPRALARLEQGERASGRLGRTLLLRAAKAMAGEMVPVEEGVSA
ncbi:uncharacterized protein PD653_1063 [Nocardioides sp. PD653]|nr:uncharacterized protein PD653B2_0348 [Nocardioides sp. PD653-B2]GAW53660.1 uncharacterized protein PD653_1063 [Nocardioides sp. PD653]